MRVTRTPSGWTRKVDRRCLPFDVGIRGEDDFLDAAAPHARQQLLDLQIVGPDAVQRRQGAHQHVVEATEVARLLHRRHVLGLLDDANDFVVAAVMRAEVAGIRARR